MGKIIEIISINDQFAQLVCEMRNVMNALNHKTKKTTLGEAVQEANDYFTNNRRVFALEENKELIGYSVLKIEDKVCWLDWLFVTPAFQRKGIASLLFSHAEAYAEDLGNDQLYIWVHPDNHGMLNFLRKNGYDVLNLIEIKKKKPVYKSEITIFGNKLRY